MAEKVHPIRPDEIGAVKEKIFPDAVMEAFNELISADFEDGQATVRQDEVVALMIKKGLSGKDIDKHGWLNIEEIYGKDWKVEYDKSDSDNSSYFTFTIRKRRKH